MCNKCLRTMYKGMAYKSCRRCNTNCKDFINEYYPTCKYAPYVCNSCSKTKNCHFTKNNNMSSLTFISVRPYNFFTSITIFGTIITRQPATSPHIGSINIIKTITPKTTEAANKAQSTLLNAYPFL